MGNAQSVQKARSALAALVEEQAGLPHAIDRARRSGAVDEWMRLETRHVDLPDEITLARLVLAEAELAAARSLMPAAEAEAEHLRNKAKAMRDGVDTKRAEANKLLEEARAGYEEAPRLNAEASLVIARAIALTEKHAEERDQLRRVLGPKAPEMPDDDNSALPERARLAASITLTHPLTGEPVTFLPGTVPPAWVASLISNPAAWSASALGPDDVPVDAA